jgi:hypothetical protein
MPESNQVGWCRLENGQARGTPQFVHYGRAGGRIATATWNECSKCTQLSPHKAGTNGARTLGQNIKVDEVNEANDDCIATSIASRMPSGNRLPLVMTVVPRST